MGFLSDLFHKKKKAESNVGGMEDFMTLIRVYYQSTLAAQLGIGNLASMPDLLAFKRSLHVPTANNKLGVAERKACKQLMQNLYGISENFFKEIDQSIKKNCRKQQDVPSYLYAFQGFSQELMMLVGNLMKWKFRIPQFLKKAMRSLTDQTVSDVFTKNSWKDAATQKAVASVRRYQHMLGFSQQWAQEYVYNFIVLAKREPKPSSEDVKKAEAKMKQ